MPKWHQTYHDKSIVNTCMLCNNWKPHTSKSITVLKCQSLRKSSLALLQGCTNAGCWESDIYIRCIHIMLASGMIQCTSFFSSTSMHTIKCITSTYMYQGASRQWPRPTSVALLTVSKESALTEAGNSALACTSSVFHGFAGSFSLWVCVLHVTIGILRQLS